MKIYFSIAALLLLFPLVAFAQTPPPSIDVSGSADVKVVPDEVFIVFGVETSDPSLAVSKSQNDETVKKLLALTKDFQIDPKHVQTDFITIDPWMRDMPDGPDIREFRVRKNISITLKDVARFEALMSRAVEIGITNIHGVQFRTTELRKHRDHAREMAVQAAREKAELLAAQLGRKVGPAIRISEYGGGWYSAYNWWGQSYGGGMSQVSSQSGDAGQSSGTIALGQITVTATVSVSFSLQ
jgi:uncharacterized protein